MKLTTKNSDIQLSILGLGWLGLPLGNHLITKGFSVKGSQTKDAKVPTTKIKTYSLVIPSDKNLNWLTQDNENFFKSDILIITLPFKRQFNPSTQYLHQINNCIDAIKKTNQINHIIFTSSTAIYPNKETPWKESDKILNCSTRSQTLIEIENTLLNINGISSTILRLGGLYGPNRVPGRFIKTSTKKINGNDRVNLTHLNDCMNAVQTVIEGNRWNEIFNIVSDEHPTKKEFYGKQAKKQGLSPPMFIDNSSFGKIISNAKSKNILNLTYEPLP
ncbi:hypothetical protein HOH45_01135 [bacterium]|jgi:nucleoside-diphosphate-sugar epimerase|nr:hypothetical protein [bacterium]